MSRLYPTPEETEAYEKEGLEQYERSRVMADVCEVESNKCIERIKEIVPLLLDPRVEEFVERIEMMRFAQMTRDQALVGDIIGNCNDSDALLHDAVKLLKRLDKKVGDLEDRVSTLELDL